MTRSATCGRGRAGRSTSRRSVPSASGIQHTVPIEAKWIASGWRAEARIIEGTFHAGVLATRTLLDTTKPAWALPAPLVALLLE